MFSYAILYRWATIPGNCPKNLDGLVKTPEKPGRRINTIPRWK